MNAAANELTLLCKCAIAERCMEQYCDRLEAYPQSMVRA